MAEQSNSGDMTVVQLREWLRNWVAEATGQPVTAISDDRPLEEFGLSSRDAVALSGEIEEVVGVTLTATVAYQHPTIASLATRIIEGEPEGVGTEDSYYLAAPTGRSHDVAIVGLATRFPGAGSTPESMWEMLKQGRDGITDLPEGRWSEFLTDPRLRELLDKTVTKGGYLDDVKGFDNEFFAMSPREAVNVDPQQRLALELAWEALEHAHIPANELKGTRTGVFMGSSTNDYQFIALGDPEPHPYALTGTSTAIVANRVSYFYDFRGPSVTMDTACSSSLVAVHQAVRSLREGESDLALAGGVNMLLAPPATIGFGQTGVLAPDGRIKAFSADADGMIRSEGGGLVVLKRLEDAERDGDTIYAVIAGSAVNQDGRSNGLAAPNPDAQADVLRDAYRDAGIVPSGVDYIEAHGTGTILGDPIEADALGRVVGRGRADDKPALLGSAKTNFGHLEAAAGAAGLIKVVLAMTHDHVPASLNYAGPNPYIPFDSAHLKVVDEGAAWPRYTGVAVAGVSGFGFGGTNAHVVVREYVPANAGAPTEVFTTEVSTTEVSATEVSATEHGVNGSAIEPAPGTLTPLVELTPVLLAVSAAMPSRRRRAASDLADWLETEVGSLTPLTAVARSLATRNHGRSRAVVIARTHAEAVTGLRAVAAGKPAGGVFSADAPAPKDPVWVFSGFGAQHRLMAKEFYGCEPVFAAALDRVDLAIQDEAGYSITEIVLDDSRTYEFENSQVAIFAIQVALVDTLVHYGARPAAVLGHSMGEVAAAYAVGGLGLEDAVRVIFARSRLLGEAQENTTDAAAGAMALVEYSADQIGEMTDLFPGVEPSVYAAPTHTTVGGPAASVQALVDHAVSLGKMGRVLDVRGAGHTSAVDPLLGELTAELVGIEPGTPTMGVFSSVHRDAYYRPGHDPIHGLDYWTTGMRYPVYFTQAVRQAVEFGYTTFVELAPNPIALMSVGATAWDTGVPDAALIPLLKRKESERETFLAALATLHIHGHPVSLPTLYGPGPYADLPRTAFVRKPLWIDAHVILMGGGLPVDTVPSGAAAVPGAHVGLPDGRHVWETSASAVSDVTALVRAAAEQVMPDVTVGSVLQHLVLDPESTLTTTLTAHPGGGSLTVHARRGPDFTLVAEAVVTAGERVMPAGPEVLAPSLPVNGTITQYDDVIQLEDSVVAAGDRWDPDGPQSLSDRLAIIVAESMGYAVEDLPPELPLVELGLDSLMATRIKNRVEYEFDIPQLQLQAVRDASLREVEKYLRYAVENRDEVAALAADQNGSVAIGEGIDLAAIAAEKEAAALAAVESAAAAPEAPAPEAHAPEAPAPEAPAPEAADTDSHTAVPDLGDIVAATGGDVAPRDTAERLVFATWATVTGESAKGVHNILPVLDEETAERMAARLSKRTGGDITIDDVLDAETIEALANSIREHLETGEVDGVVRILRAREEGSDAVPVFVFHPAGSSCVVYEPLLRRLPPGTPMYGLERVEGSIEDRAAAYVPVLQAIQGDGPYVLVGWSLGGVLAYTVARLLREQGADVRYVGLIDTVFPYEPIPETPEEIRERWKRYAAVVGRLNKVEIPLPFDELAHADEEGQIRIVLDMVKLSGNKVPSGIIEHQRTSWLDNRAVQTAVPGHYSGHVTLYMADKYQDDAIECEPRYGKRRPDGGWGEYTDNLEVVYIGGDHLAVIDEPYIAKIGADLSAKLDTLALAPQGK